jgi:hypothetical protein
MNLLKISVIFVLGIVVGAVAVGALGYFWIGPAVARDKFDFGYGMGELNAQTEFVHAPAPQYQTKQVLQTDLNNLPGQEIIVFASTWQPGFRLPLHMHPNGH